MVRDDPDRALLASTLDEAVDALLGARVLLGGVEEADAPTEALDAALRASEGVRQARREFDRAIADLREALGGDPNGRAMAVEAAYEVVGRACDATWALAASIRRARRGRRG
jgi:hypothetical protein